MLLEMHIGPGKVHKKESNGMMNTRFRVMVISGQGKQ